MIISFIITFLTSVIIWFLNLLPLADSSITNSVSSNFSNFKTWIQTANNVFPVDTLFQILGLMLVLEAGLYLWKRGSYIVGIITAGILKR